MMLAVLTGLRTIADALAPTAAATQLDSVVDCAANFLERLRRWYGKTTHKIHLLAILNGNDNDLLPVSAT
ncbi:hypothetical protein A2477_03225 [Candidatus Falkowbacteria bacterium RIFOXYC2_FULL_47_12]|uniref:Uncharacterized protein n=2 Tax=Candidatus Falkowiibacteriota TaxID=1752728 RepID=A0A1F5TR25_9BACT|nr:MAG: hypothetical protein A2242_04860 [Candidatus Falkowbacteria bacterium RIFOXYA2_FULL_47_9]OGF40981.1 MAG: hypothetical protein A2477_03225 [Candidatus Falkowbacteria bacterium RIFOXYC2_FULL_47_12]